LQIDPDITHSYTLWVQRAEEEEGSGASRAERQSARMSIQMTGNGKERKTVKNELGIGMKGYKEIFA